MTPSTNEKVPSLFALVQRGEFEHGGHTWKLERNEFGWVLYKDHQLLRKYNDQMGISQDILSTIGYPV